MQRLPIEREDAADKIGDECVEFGVRHRSIDPAVALCCVGVEVVRTQDDLQGARPANEERQPLKRSAPWYQTDSNLRLSENHLLLAGKPNIARQDELTAATPNSSAYDRNAQHTAIGKPCRRINPARYPKAAARSRRAIVRDRKIGICAFERNHLKSRIDFNLTHEVVKRIVHSIVDHIDRRVVQRNAPMAHRGLVDDECVPGVAHSYLPDYRQIKKTNRLVTVSPNGRATLRSLGPHARRSGR